MRITVELSLYPLDPGFVGPITDFIRELRTTPELEVVTNAMSTQVRGEFEAVTTAINRCARNAMSGEHPVVLVAKYINADLDIAHAPKV
jgi:uncharacterized protein YqgV (UPF0045/DUF77 family)